MAISMDYISLCVQLYNLGVTPSNNEFRKSGEFNKFLNQVEVLVKRKGVDEFYLNTLNAHYFINLWTAHLILEFFAPHEKMKNDCLEIIQRYASGRLNKKVAQEEQKWLKDNGMTYLG